MCIWWLAKIQKCFAEKESYRITWTITMRSADFSEKLWNELSLLAEALNIGVGGKKHIIYTCGCWNSAQEWLPIISMIVGGGRWVRLTHQGWVLLLFIILVSASCHALKWTEKLPPSTSPQTEARDKKWHPSALWHKTAFLLGKYFFSSCFFYPQSLMYRGISFKCSI